MNSAIEARVAGQGAEISRSMLPWTSNERRGTALNEAEVLENDGQGGGEHRRRRSW